MFLLFLNPLFLQCLWLLLSLPRQATLGVCPWKVTLSQLNSVFLLCSWFWATKPQMASLRTDTGFFKETILIPSRPTMTSFFYLFLLQFTRLLIPTEHRASVWVREWATTQNQLFRPRKLRRGTSSVPLSRVWYHCFYEALTSWPCYAWLRIRQGREDLAWIGRETRAAFQGWHPQDKLKWTGNRQCSPSGDSAFAEESRRQERNKFTHFSGSDTSRGSEVHWLHSLQLIHTPRAPCLKENFQGANKT